MSNVPLDGAWSRDGVMIFAALPNLMRCEAGGVASLLTTADNARGETSHRFPAFLPDGRHFVYLGRSIATGKSGIHLGSLDAKPEQQRSEFVTADTSNGAVYVPSQDPDPSGSSLGYLLFVQGGSIMAQPFDARRLALAGEAVPIADDLGDGVTYSASMTGVLAYQASRGFRGLTWVDRKGNPGGTPPDIPSYANNWNLSPDGTRMAGVAYPPGAGAGEGEIWLYNFAQGNSSRFTSGSGNGNPVWSKDGSRIIFASRHDSVTSLIQKDSNGAGNEEVLFKSSEDIHPYDWSPDGRFLLYSVWTHDRKDSLWVLSLSDRKSTLYLKRDAILHQPRFSPDGNCVAYASNESGKQEVYVQPFPNPQGSKWHVSNGGFQPRWRADGKELFYTTDSKMMAVDVVTTAGKCDPAINRGIPKALFTTPSFGSLARSHQYEVTPDGNNFLLRETARAAAPITVVLNWTAGLKK